ncbi:MAG: phosphate ABC transporter permease PstA [Mycoplasmataceae bacterium]|nr:phosphate ABC transporter permease PstA [Mycoplasmataceae bacterium]
MAVGLLKKKQNADRTSKIVSMSLSWLFSLVFFLLIVFIVYASVPGFKAYGWSILGGTFDMATGKASVWLPLCITIMISLLAIVIAGPVGIKTAMFIKYRLPVKYQKVVRIAIELLADIPSVIFGLFASEMLGVVLKYIFHMSTSYNLITTGFMLTFMVLPTIVSLSLNALDGVDATLITASMVLGNTKTRSIYKVCKKDARNGITVGIIIALARAIGETMAVSMILQSQGYNPIFDQGFWAVATSGLRSLGSLIAANMFAEGGGPALQSLLFAFGLFMFIFVMILNGVAMYATKKKKKSKWAWWNKMEKGVAAFILFIPTQFKMLWEKITYHSKVNKNANLSKYLSTRMQRNKFIHVYTGYKMFWEIVSVVITLGFLAWILIDIIGFGSVALASDSQTVFSFVNNSTGQAFVNTLLIIIIAIGIGLPLSLMIAIYLNEFSKDGKIKKTLLFFVDSLGATPSILFGMFGLIFFLQTMGMSAGGSAGKSIIAGALTILIVILPTFIRTIQQALQSIPKELRTNSYALGAGKWETIRKIVLPAARQGITTAVILSIGRILAETAPLYLTSGLSSSSSISLINPGQTLTTRIYAQIYTANVTQGTNIMYECAFVTMILVLLIILLVHVVIPAYYNYKRRKIRKEYDELKLKEQKITNATNAMNKLLIPKDRMTLSQHRLLDKKIIHKIKRKKKKTRLKS